MNDRPPEHAGPLLEVEDLNVRFFTRVGVVEAVRGVSLTIERGETVGLVGESGSGKSVTALAVLGLLQLPGKITGGDIRWKGRSLLDKPGRRYVRAIRGKELAIVFQDPMTSLNPVFSVGQQIGEVVRRHLGLSRAASEKRTLELLELVGIPSARQRARAHPHELSGGMRQRVMIAMALACEPQVLIADEPTTALDVTVQAQILELIGELQRQLGLAVLLITHDLGVVAGVCRRVVVMYGGKVVENGPAEELFERPGHPYTAGLLRSTPRLDLVRSRLVGIDGSPPNMIGPPTGCPYHPRCPLVIPRCIEEMPPLDKHDPGREVACWRAFAESIGAAEPDVTRAHG